MPEGEIHRSSHFQQDHEDIVLDLTWWWGGLLALTVSALISNLFFLITVVYNRKRIELKTFVTAVIITISVLDILDVFRVFALLSRDLFYEQVFRHVFCSIGIFHELSVSMFLIAISIAVCVQAGREVKLYHDGHSRNSSLGHKILIPIVLFLSLGAAVPFFLIDYKKLDYTCTDPFRIQHLMEHEDLFNRPTGPLNREPQEIHEDSLPFDIYSTCILVFTYILPVIIIPLTIPISLFKTCFANQCCVPRFKQPIGEMIMACIITLIYLATIVGVVLPRLDRLMQWEQVRMETAPLLWQLANNCARPLCYFLMNPGIWDGTRYLCCGKKSHYVHREVEENEIPLNPVTSV